MPYIIAEKKITCHTQPCLCTAISNVIYQPQIYPTLRGAKTHSY